MQSIAYLLILFFLAAVIPRMLYALDQGCDDAVQDCTSNQHPVEIVTVHSHRLLRSLQNNGNFSRINAEEIDFIQHGHINEMTNRLANTWVSRGSGQEHLTAIRSPVLTGAGACGAFLYLNDGIPIRPIGFCNINNLFELNTEQAAQIELVRGPAGAAYGGNALNGLINVVNRSSATEDDYLMLAMGSEEYRRLMFASHHEVAAHNLAVYGNIAESNSFREGEGYQQQKTTSVYDYHGDDWWVSSSFSTSNLNQTTAGFVRGFEAYKDDELRSSNESPDAFRDAQSFRLVTKFQRVVLLEHTLSIAPYWRQSKMQFLQHFLPGTPLEENGQLSRGIITRYRMPDWDIGIQLETASGFLREYQQDSINTSIFLQETRPAGWHYDYRVDSQASAVYLNYERAVAQRLRFLAGLRYEVLRYEYSNYLQAGNARDDGSLCGFGGCLFLRPADRHDRFTNTAARIGVNYHWHQQHQFFINMNQGFRAPQATELYRLQSGQNVADLDSVLMDAVEVGVRGGIGEQDRLQYELIGFKQKKKNMIFRDANGNQMSGAKTDSSGWEVMLKYVVSARQQLMLNGSHARYIYDFDGETASERIVRGNDVDTAPRTMWNLRWLLSINHTFRLELEAQHQGEYYLNAENSAFYNGREASVYPGHTLFNIRAQYAVDRHWFWYGGIRNVLNTYYAERADYTQFGPPGPSNRFRYFPGALRTFNIALKYRY